MQIKTYSATEFLSLKRKFQRKFRGPQQFYHCIEIWKTTDVSRTKKPHQFQDGNDFVVENKQYAIVLHTTGQKTGSMSDANKRAKETPRFLTSSPEPAKR